MGLALALGVNLWVVAVALPLALGMGGAEADRWGGLAPLAAAIAALAPLGVLGAGVRLRSTSALLVGFPLLAVLPEALAPAELSARVLPAAATVLAALSLVGYLVAVAHALAADERAAATISTATTRRLSQDPTPSRWRRRLRVYRGLVALSVVMPAALLAMVDLWPDFTASLAASFGVHAARAQALCTVAVGLLWIGLLRAYVLGPLQLHLQHDRDLLATIESDRRHARKGRPRASFYFSVAVALAAMTAVVWQRAR